MAVSYYYMGNTFIFSEVDARLYEGWSYSIKDLTYEQKLSQLSSYEELEFDDWGAPLTMSFILKILPYKEFLNFIYIILNTVSTCMLFAIGKTIMDKRYSYVGALLYGTASYTVFFMGSFLKETMLMFLVISSIYFLYKYRTNKKLVYIVLGLCISLLIFFFRPVITITVWLSYLIYFLFVEKRLFLRIILSVLAVVIVFFAFNLAAELFFKYRIGREALFGDFTLFDRLVFVIGGLIGPFPSLLQIGPEFTEKPLYGAGLLFKLMLVFCFWRGFFYSIGKRVYDALPLYVFIIVETIELILLFDSLELRKSLPHIPFFILTSIWYIYQIENSSKNKKKIIRTKYWIAASSVIAIVIVFSWNILTRQ
ncbi:MAG: hypothetical protein J6W86_08795 [Bacteroidales bacterium]|nr:hypothetical protein [Bacteroidales bacterium]